MIKNMLKLSNAYFTGIYIRVLFIEYLSDLSFGTSDEGEYIENVTELSLRSGLQYSF